MLRTVTPANKELQQNMLPEVEDVPEQDERTMIVNKIRISRIKGSHASLLSPNDQVALTSNKSMSITPFNEVSRRLGGTGD